MEVTHRAILDLWGTQQQLLEALKTEGLEVGQSTVSMWKARGVPSLYWPALVKLAQDKTLPDGSPVTFELLACSQPRLLEGSA